MFSEKVYGIQTATEDFEDSVSEEDMKVETLSDEDFTELFPLNVE